MSRHEGVSCDACMKGNFRGKRYKCLICYDYDLCANCYDSGATTSRHTTDHPMQCILTRTDIDLYFGGESLTAEPPQSFTCPFCGKMGFTEATLQEHVTAEHADSSTEVVCPICAALPSGDPNHMTDDFAAHLTLEHRTPHEFDEPLGGIRHVRRIPHPGRGGGTRTRRAMLAGNALSGLSSSSRETMDPIAELLSQLSSVRSRAAAAQSVSSQLQQLEMQLQSTRQQLERLPRRQADSSKTAASGVPQTGVVDLTIVSNSNSSNSSTGGSPNTQFLLARCCESEFSEQEKQVVEVERADRSLFVQELLLSTLAAGLRLDSDDEPITMPPQETLTALPSSSPATTVAPSAESATTTAIAVPAPSSSDLSLDAAESSDDVTTVTTETTARTPVGKSSSSSLRNKVKHLDSVKNSGKESLPVLKH
ncbi:E3 ubiquitin-protein ligase KCMF1 [Lamellibrachia satsuma]|nr:E3 ubiquitin-protein ligase KCMF1 [Lamellibrachia satsuma]